MTRRLRGLRGDLRLALRPACVVVLVGAAIVCGLTSALMQEVSYGQLESATTAVREHIWRDASCGAQTRACQAQDHRDTMRFYAEQRRVASHVGTLQTVPGAIAFASAFMGLASGAAVVALLATLTIAGEWVRGTIRLALSGSVTPRELALRRFAATLVLAVAAWVCTASAAIIAGWIGGSALPLFHAHASVADPLIGGAVLTTAYAALATSIAWLSREPLRTLLAALAVVGVVAASSALGGAAPGSAVPAAVGIHRLFEFEIGYFWWWPEVTFPGAVRLVNGPSWGVATASIGTAALVMLAWLSSHARRFDAVD